MKIYTRTGDQGTTSLYSGTRVSKNHPLIEALGAVDEGNSTLGIALSLFPKDSSIEELKKQLIVIQHALFDVGAALATPLSSHEKRKIEKTRFDENATKKLEEWIDQMESQLPRLHTFILPGGHSSGAFLHLARSIIRRSERLVYPLFEQREVSHNVLIYLNRLSDFLFVAARYVNHKLQVSEFPWQSHISPDF